MLPKRPFLVLFLVAICSLVQACAGVKQLGHKLSALVEVRGEVMRRFGEENVSVNSDANAAVVVTFVNSPLNEKGIALREKRAQETAEVVRDHYPDIKSIRTIMVVFMQVKTAFVVLSSSRVLDFHGFDNRARLLPSGVESNTKIIDPSQPTVVYSANRYETDIGSEGIQLEGSPENGVTWVPHFSVRGNINKVTQEPPDEVSFDFASFANKPRFPNVSKIVFTTDGKTTYKTEGQFSTSNVVEGMRSEFLYLKVPSQDFIKIADGKSVSIKIAKQQYELTEQQLLLIKRMTDYLKK